MTENEIINRLHLHGETMTQDEAFFIMDALEEIQQIKEVMSDFPLDCGNKAKDIEEVWKQLKTYLAIGTVEEFKALKEKNEPKKVDEEYCCPICHTCGMDDDGIAGTYCTDCGQKLDWQ